MHMNEDMVKYYRDRAQEYERIYHKPERQEDIRAGGQRLKEIFKGKSVLEIACGTGFWTEFISESADFVLATDVNQTVIDIAQSKGMDKRRVEFKVADLYTFKPEQFSDSLFGGFI